MDPEFRLVWAIESEAVLNNYLVGCGCFVLFFKKKLGIACFNVFFFLVNFFLVFHIKYCAHPFVNMMQQVGSHTANYKVYFAFTK